MRPAFALALAGIRCVLAAQFSSGSIVALRLSNGGAALGLTTGNAVLLDEFSSSGSKLQTIAAPSTSCSIGGSVQVSYIYEGRLTSSTDSQLVSFTCYSAASGAAVASASRQLFSVGVNGVLSSPVATGLSGVAAFAAVKVANNAASGFYHGGSAGLYYTAAAGGSSTLMHTYDATSIVIWANSLCKLRNAGLQKYACTVSVHHDALRVTCLAPVADFTSSSAGFGVYLVGTPGVLPTTASQTITQITSGAYDTNRWASGYGHQNNDTCAAMKCRTVTAPLFLCRFVFQSGTRIWMTDEGYNTGTLKVI